MKQGAFEAARRPVWESFVQELDRDSRRGWSSRRRMRESTQGADSKDLPSLYREVSRDLALARDRAYSDRLQEELNEWVLRGHQELYRAQRSHWSDVFSFLAFGFPILLRQRSKRFFFCMMAFCIPFFLMWWAGSVAPEWVLALLGEDTIASMNEMYGNSDGLRGRSAERGFSAFAFYIRNNVGIDFRVFAGGILAGVGSLFFLGFNAFFLGAVFGYIHMAGHNDNFLPFVAGHGAFEITGLWVSALAGLEVGMAWISPGEKSRRFAMVEGARTGLKLLGGAAALTALAAVVEGFWSPSSVPVTIKYWVGGALWVLTALYLMFAGRSREA
ncbi:MAG: stage II sporulation protein M [Planctomycetota bacterium]|nr:stage II sporulation protein M [Planctomycetota bacterium]